MTQSGIKPDPIRVDIIRNGAARLECAWNIVETKTKDGELMYNYDFEIIWWALPEPAYIQDRKTLSEIGNQYILENMVEIMGWVQAKECI